MNRLRFTPAIAAVLLLLGACGSDTSASDDPTPTPSPSASHSIDTEQVMVTDAWVRATAGTDDPSMTAAFMTLDNFTDADVTLVSAEADVTMMVQIHEMAMGEDGAMVMREIEDGLLIEQGGHAHLEPGGNHIMLMGLTDELAPGDEVTLTLHFSDGTMLEITAPVKEFTEEEGEYEEHTHEGDEEK